MVAELISRGGTSPPWAVALEVEARRRSTILDRLLEYLSRLLRKLRHGPHKRDRYLAAGVLLVLSGRKPKPVALQMQLPGTDLELKWKAEGFYLAAQDAAATLGRIARGELGRSILCWLPLMVGGGEAATVQEWKRLAEQEPNEQRRKEYAGLAAVFAEWVGRLPVWRETLEGLTMWESQMLREREKAVELRTSRSALLRVLRARFQAEVPADLTQAIQQMTDSETLSRWFDASLDASSLDAFRAAIQGGGNPPTQTN
jgi:hypothetical protein